MPFPPAQGSYYPPTVLAQIPEAAAVRQEEFFGPVAMLFCARKDINDAMRIANDIPFGLGSALWSHDEAEIEAFLARYRSGARR